ncbi:elongation factor P--(R)-beta-lysine ligase [Spirochaetia bacterium]|nr:elongation factor P--(R)-beta-lysine ligase [Spirochaetia bacterium]
MDIELLRERSRIIRQVRAFFDERQYLEVDTPLLSPDLIPESCLEVFETSRIPPPGSKTRLPEPYWLIPSPEIWMKKLIADHRQNLYQICKCFRNGESTGRFHSPEFTMLEYYTMDADYRDSLSLTEELFSSLLKNSDQPGLRPPFLRITMEEAFSRWAGFDLYKAAAEGSMEDEARRLGLDPLPGLDTASLYDLIFIHTVEPNLPKDKPAALTDYPAFVPCLAQKNRNGKTVERWELYARGIELANCYSEETDAEEVRRFFETEFAEKEKHALVKHHVDQDYWKNFLPRSNTVFPKGKSSGFPPCSGVAMGLDRLIMVLTGRSAIDGVLPFPMA